MYGPTTIGVLGDGDMTAAVRGLVRSVRVVRVANERRLLALMAAGRLQAAAVPIAAGRDARSVQRLARAAERRELPVIFLVDRPATAQTLVGAAAARPTVAIAYTLSEIPAFAALLIRRFAGLEMPSRRPAPYTRR